MIQRIERDGIAALLHCVSEFTQRQRYGRQGFWRVLWMRRYVLLECL